MRCKNCGWENMDGTLRCEKCNSPLTATTNEATVYGGLKEPNAHGATQPMPNTPDFGGTVTDVLPNTPPPYNGDMMHTVREASPYMSQQSNQQPESIGEGTQRMASSNQPEESAAQPVCCPVCEYLITEDTSVCPNCNTPLVRRETAAMPLEESAVTADTPEMSPVAVEPVAVPVPLEPVAAPAPVEPIAAPVPIEPVAAPVPAPVVPIAVPEMPSVAVTPQKPTEGRVCPSCGASVLDNAKFCPSCGSSIQPRVEAAPAVTPHINRVTMGTAHSATVLPGFEKLQPQPPKPVHYCTLRRREWPGEMVKYTPTTYSGDSVVLNRMNTDQHNNTITSKQQAIVSYENGQWYIEDRSALQSTYVRVKGKVPINPGDIILLGNREFEFEGF